MVSNILLLSQIYIYIYIYILQQNVFLATKISDEIFFVAKNTAIVTKDEFYH